MILMLEIRVGRMKKNMIKFQASLDRWKNEWMNEERKKRPLKNDAID